jgi:hypothetical protein
MVADQALRVDAFAVRFAVGVVTDEVGVEDVGELGGEGGDTAVRADRSPPFVRALFVPAAHRSYSPLVRGALGSCSSSDWR